MSILDSMVEIPRRTMVLFFLVDVSGSMHGTKITSVNTAIEEVLPEIEYISAENADARIKIAVLTFSTGVDWLYDRPVEVEDFAWKYLDASGVTNFGSALNELNKKLSKKEFMEEAHGSFAPVIFLMSDGIPTDDYIENLEKIKTNSWFANAIKVAVAIGSDADQSVLTEFTGTSESVITVKNSAELGAWIKFLSKTVSEIGSRGLDAGQHENKQKDVEMTITDVRNNKGGISDMDWEEFEEDDEW